MKIIQSKEDFAATIANGVVLIDFFAEWCGPCKMLGPALDEISKEITDVIIGKVNIDDLPDIAVDQSVRALPTLVLYKDGKEIDRIVGAKSKSDLIKWINSKK